MVSHHPHITQVAPTILAAVTGPAAFADFPVTIRTRLDRVWEALRGGLATKHGHNVVLYCNRPGQDPIVVCGVQIERDFPPTGGISCETTPGGRAAMHVHRGDPAGLPAVHRCLVEWCTAHGLARTGVTWEVYGDWEEDISRFRTDVFHELAEPM